MFGVEIGNMPLTQLMGTGIMQVIDGGTPPVVEFVYLLDEEGNDLLDSADFYLTARHGRIFWLADVNKNYLDDVREFGLEVRG